MPVISGGCLCGKVRYRADADPAFIGVCHCRNCQKSSGSAFSIVVGVPQPGFTVQGQLKTFNDKGESGKTVYRRFCPSCGSSMLSEIEVMPGMIILKAGTLDDPSWVRPTMQLYCDSAQPWVKLGAEMKRFPRMSR